MSPQSKLKPEPAFQADWYAIRVGALDVAAGADPRSGGARSSDRSRSHSTLSFGSSWYQKMRSAPTTVSNTFPTPLSVNEEFVAMTPMDLQVYLNLAFGQAEGELLTSLRSRLNSTPIE